jgi:hypothetical protein
MFGHPENLSEVEKSQSTTNYQSNGTQYTNQACQDQPIQVAFLKQLTEIME